ncbi:MAG: polysaccharide biosynthesis/export family protein [candidate division WOR-3 bacterium]
MKRFIILFLISFVFAEEVYKIEPGDLLEIIVFGEEELTRDVMVMHNGNISFPLIGEIKLAGLTLKEAEDTISEKLKTYFTHPLVSIILKSPTSPHVSVFGEVLRPGAIPYQRGLRITDYIALAGGPTPDANLKKVRIVKFINEKPVSMRINVEEIIKKGKNEKNFELKSGEWVYIPKKFKINWGIVLNTLALTVSVLNLYITLERIK